MVMGVWKRYHDRDVGLLHFRIKVFLEDPLEECACGFKIPSFGEWRTQFGPWPELKICPECAAAVKYFLKGIRTVKADIEAIINDLTLNNKIGPMVWVVETAAKQAERRKKKP